MHVTFGVCVYVCVSVLFTAPWYVAQFYTKQKTRAKPKRLARASYEPFHSAVQQIHIAVPVELKPTRWLLLCDVIELVIVMSFINCVH